MDPKGKTAVNEKSPALTFVEVERELVKLAGLEIPDSGLAYLRVTIFVGVFTRHGLVDLVVDLVLVIVVRRRGDAQLVEPLVNERGHVLLGRHLRSCISD